MRIGWGGDDSEFFSLVGMTIDGENGVILRCFQFSTGGQADSGTGGDVPELEIPGEQSGESSLSHAGQVQCGTAEIDIDVMIEEMSHEFRSEIGEDITGEGDLAVGV